MQLCNAGEMLNVSYGNNIFIPCIYVRRKRITAGVIRRTEAGVRYPDERVITLPKMRVRQIVVSEKYNL